MFVIRFSITLLLIVLLSVSAFAQGDILKRGESGVELMGGFLFDRLSSGYGGQFSICIGGAVDLGFAMTWSNQDHPYENGKKIAVQALSPFITFNILNSSRNDYPFGASLLLAFINTKDDYTDMTISRVGLGISIFKNVLISEFVTFQPRGGINLYSESGEADKAGFYPLVILGFSMIFDTEKNKSVLIRIAPLVSYFKKEISYEIDFGLIVPFGKSGEKENYDW